MQVCLDIKIVNNLKTKNIHIYYLIRDVQNPSSGQKALDILCGSHEGGCSPKGFVEFIGNNPESPFKFLMNITDEEYDFNSTLHIKPANTTLHKCSQNIDLPYYKAESCGCSVR